MSEAERRIKEEIPTYIPNRDKVTAKVQGGYTMMKLTISGAKDYVILNRDGTLAVDPKTLPKEMQNVLSMDSYEMFKANRDKLKNLAAREK